MYKIFIFILGLTVISCQNSGDQSSKNKLTAKVKNIENETFAYISEYGEGNKLVAIDTLEIKDDQFIFNLPEKDYQTLNSIRVEGVKGLIYFVNEKEPIDLTIIKGDNDFLVSDPDIQAGEANTLFTEYMAFLNETEEKIHHLSDEYSQEELQDPEIKSELQEQEGKAIQEITAYRRKAIKEHPNTLTSAYILADLLSSRAVSPTKLEEIYDSLSDDIKETFIGQELGHVIIPSKGVKVGDTAPDFTARNPGGTPVSLGEVLDKKGQFTLVEFWASWCPNCQAEMPHLVKVYEEYHDKGLNIIGISIDNDKAEWEKAIEDFGMEWTQISNLNEWQDPIVREYGVQSIPTNYLLDKNGEVIAINLNSDALKEKLQETLD